MSKEAMKLALEALEESLGYVEEEAENAQRLYGQYPTRQARIQGLKDDVRKHMKAITALREALAEQPAQQEPVECANGCRGFVKHSPPAQRKPLTDEQIIAANYPDGEENGPTIAAPDFELICFARQIEAAHGIKENT